MLRYLTTSLENLASSPSERSYQEMVCAYGQYKKEVLG